MPPKIKKTAEERTVDVVPHRDDRKESMSSEATLGRGSEASALSLSSETLERILAANTQTFLEASKDSLSALLAALPSPVAAVSSSTTVATSSRAHVKTPKSSDDEIPFEYFVKFEKAMMHNRIAKSEWGHLLPAYLSGKAQAFFTQVTDDMLDDYELVKETMLESLGDTPARQDRRWWTMARQTGEDPGAFYLRVRSTGLQRLHGLRSREEVVEIIILSRFLSLLPQECYSSVVTKCPKNDLEASRLVQAFEETRSFARRHQPWRNSSAGQHTQ